MTEPLYRSDARLSGIDRIEVTEIEKKGKQNRRARIRLSEPGAAS